MQGTQVQKIAAGVIFKDSKVLICQRSEEGSFPLKWEFPGGKIEPGESPREALRRELVEELAIDITIEEELLSYEYIYPGGFTVHLTFFLITDFVPEPVNLQFHDIKWVSVDSLEDYDFLEGDQSLINLLQYRSPEFS